MARNDPFTAGRDDFAGNIVAPGMRTGGGAPRQMTVPDVQKRTGGTMTPPQAPMPFPQSGVGLPPAGQFGQGFGYGMTRPRAPIRGTSY